MRKQMHWRLSLPPWLLQPERQRKYLSTVMTCIVQDLLLKTTKSRQGPSSQISSRDFNWSRAERLAIPVHWLRIVWHFFLMTLKRRLPLEGKPLNSTKMRSHKHCIADRMMEFSSTAYQIKRHMRYSKKLMMICVKLTNLVQNLEINSEDWDIIGPR